MIRYRLAHLFGLCVSLAAPAGAQLRVAYAVRIDTAHTDLIAVEL